MARIKITRNGPDDPSYFLLQDWTQQIQQAMDQTNSEFSNTVYLETQNGEDPVSFEVVNPMMETTDYINVADSLFKYSNYQYWVEN